MHRVKSALFICFLVSTALFGVGDIPRHNFDTQETRLLLSEDVSPPKKCCKIPSIKKVIVYSCMVGLVVGSLVWEGMGGYDGELLVDSNSSMPFNITDLKPV